MSIEHILERIDEETKEAVGAVMAAAEAEAGAISEEFAEKAARLEEELEQDAREKAVEESRRLIVNEELRLRKELLEKKREILDRLYVEAAEKIKTLAQEEYLGLIAQMIAKRAVSFTEEIVVPKDQRDLFGDAFLESLNRSARQGKGGFSISAETGAFDWGVVLVEGRRRIDLSIDVLIAQLRDRIEPDIAAILFGDQ